MSWLTVRERREEPTKRVLVVSPYRVFPLIAGGKIRVWEIAAQLAKQGLEVTIAVPVSHSNLRSRRIGKRMEIAVAHYPFVHAYALQNRPFPYMYLMSFHPGYRLHLKRLLAEHDIIQFEHASFAALLDSIPADKVVTYNAHNVESDYVEAECKSPWTKNVATQRIRRLEARLVREADVVLACSEGDVARFRELYGVGETEARFEIVPNGVHLREPAEESGAKRISRRFPGLQAFPQRAIFSGSDVEHNRDAVRLILDDLAPRLRREVAFVIRGTCAKSFRPARDANVFLNVEEDDMGAYAAACTVGLNTVRRGSGTSMKVLHYLSYGLPVISTEFGMRGYPDLRPYVSVAPTQEPTKIVELLRASHKLSPEARSALARYSWVEVGASVKSLYDSLAAVESAGGN